MYSPLNSTQLNGTTLGPYWAWGSGVLTPDSDAQVLSTVIAWADSTEVAEASSRGLTDRLAYMEANPIPWADWECTSIRYAKVWGEYMAGAEASIKATRLAKYHGESLGEVSTAALPIRHRLVFNKRIPGIARTWEDVSKTELIEVRQIYAKAQSLGRSQQRLLDSVWLGQGIVNGYSSAYEAPGSVWFIRNAAAVGGVTGSSIVVPERVRQSGAALVGSADSFLAPTYKRAGDSTSDSWTMATSSALGQGFGESSVYRYPQLDTAVSEGSGLIKNTRRTRSFSATGEVIATAEAEKRLNEWNFVTARSLGYSTLRQYMTVTTTVIPGVLVGESVTVANNRAYIWFNNEVIAGAVGGVVSNRTYTFMTDKDAIANALVDSEGLASRGVFAAGLFEAQAETVGTPIRIVQGYPDNLNTTASISRLVYAINLKPGNRAPINRTYIVPYMGRLYVIESEDREVVIQ